MDKTNDDRTMPRRAFIHRLIGAVGVLALARWFRPLSALAADRAMGRMPVQGGRIGKLVRSDAQWRRILTPEQFHVLREAGTERPYSSPLEIEKRSGTYVCAGCALPLFASRWKYDSGTGWPSFYDVMPGHVETRTDHRLLVARTEYHCARCGGHQGHIFKDGPPPTGLRYCNNGVALRFVPERG